MAIIIDISTGIGGQWTLQDNGNGSDAMSEVRDPNGALFQTFAHPADSITLLSRTGQNVAVNLTESLGTASLTIGSLTSTTVRPDQILVNRVATTGNVTLTANQTITEANDDVGNDIVANQLVLDAGQSIGTGGNPLELQVAQLEAETVNGGIFLGNVGDLTIGGVTAELRGLFTGSTGSAADIVLTNSGTISLFDSTGSQTITSAGNVTLTALGATANITSTVNFDAILATGDINLSAGQDVAFGVIGTDWENDVRAGGTISVTAGRDFHIDGQANMAANDDGMGTTGGVSILAGRDVLIEDDHGLGATVVVTDGIGNVSLTTGVERFLRLAANSATAIFADDGNVTVAADRVVIESDSGITTAGSGSIRFTVAWPGRDMLLGSSTDAAIGTVEFSDAELDRLFTQNTIIGSAVARYVVVQSAITPLNNLTLEADREVLIQGAVTTSSSLTLRAGDAVTSNAASPISAGAFSVFVDGLDVDVGGGITGFDGTVTATSSTITGNAEADMLGGTTANDTIWAGDGLDLIELADGGNDTAMGEGGNDRFFFGTAMTGADTAIGGIGADSVILAGNYAGLTMGASTLQGIEIIRLLTGGGAYDYMITMNDGNVGAGQFITINATDLVAGESLAFLGTAEADGRFVVNGGAGDDTLVGGARHDELNGNGGNDTMYGILGDDTLFGGAGSDFLDGGADSDTLLYTSPSESTSVGFDRLNRFEPSRDSIDLPTAVTGWSGGVTGGTLNMASFDADMAAAINATLQPNMAAFYRPNAGTFAGRTFAVVDANADGNYTAGADYVFEFVMPLQPPELTSTYFI